MDEFWIWIPWTREKLDIQILQNSIIFYNVLRIWYLQKSKIKHQPLIECLIEFVYINTGTCETTWPILLWPRWWFLFPRSLLYFSTSYVCRPCVHLCRYRISNIVELPDSGSRDRKWRERELDRTPWAQIGDWFGRISYYCLLIPLWKGTNAFCRVSFLCLLTPAGSFRDAVHKYYISDGFICEVDRLANREKYEICVLNGLGRERKIQLEDIV